MSICDTCGSDPCLFDIFREEFIDTETWEADRDLIISKLGADNDCNRALQKYLFRNFAIWNGTMTRPPTPHPQCVLKGVRLLFSSRYYMGYKPTRDDPDNTAVNIDGDKAHGAKWIRTEDGKYKVVVDETAQDTKVEENDVTK